MRGFRAAVFWAHLLTGVAVGVVVFVMSVTGALLTFQRELTAWADTRGMHAGPPTPGALRLPAGELIRRAAEQRSAAPTAVTLRADPDAPASVAFGREGTVYVSAYTGEVLGEGSARVRAFFSRVVAWHRWLGASDPQRRAVPRAITGAANLGFLFLVVSGFFLWWPRNWSARAIANVTWFRRGLSGKARDFNWHNTIGVWSAVPLVIVVASGVVLSYRWASDGVYRAMGESPPAPAGPAPEARRRSAAPERAAPLVPARLDRLVARAEERVEGWRSIAITLPRTETDPVAFAIDAGDGGEPQKRATLALDPVSGDELRWESFASQTPGRRARSILRFAHTGEVLGMAGQIVAGLASAGAAVLVFTGLSLALRRAAAWRGRRGRAEEREAGRQLAA